MPADILQGLPDLIPTPDTIRPVLEQVEERASMLRRLLRLSLTNERKKAEQQHRTSTGPVAAEAVHAH
jgi:hypothetical protein